MNVKSSKNITKIFGIFYRLDIVYITFHTQTTICRWLLQLYLFYCSILRASWIVSSPIFVYSAYYFKLHTIPIRNIYIMTILNLWAYEHLFAKPYSSTIFVHFVVTDHRLNLSDEYLNALYCVKRCKRLEIGHANLFYNRVTNW